MTWIIIKGGPVMIPILIGSVIGLAIIINRLWLLYRWSGNSQEFTREVIENVRAGRFDEAREVCLKNPRYPLAATLMVGINKKDLPDHEVEKSMERAGNAQVKELEPYIGGLISIIGIEPLLGFLGTITGLIRAFMAWEKAGSDITVSALASGIYEAMITTAAGLIIAVPYYLVCNFIISRIKYISYELSDGSMQLAEELSAFKRGR